jgi:GNAT superfamily N-acetyltransferase
MIRPADPADLAELLRMARAFHAESGHVIPFDAATFCAFAEAVIDDANGVYLVAERDTHDRLCGMTAALAFPCWYNARVRQGQELFWFVDADARGNSAGIRLFDALEAWAKSAGVDTFSMSSTAQLNPEKLARLYMGRGYVPQDVVYTKVL